MSRAFLDLEPIRRIQGSLRLPGSKSISNRYLLLAALAEGTTTLMDVLESDDTARMLEALSKLGVKVERGSTRECVVHGVDGSFAVRSCDLFLGNAGTVFRPLTAVLALSRGEYRLSGVQRMHERPIRDLVDALRAVGAKIDYLGDEGYPPLALHPANVVTSGVVRVRGNVSSQFLTALLLAAPLTGAETRIEVVGELISKPYIDITLNAMERFGVAVRRDGWSAFTVPAAARYRSPGTLYVEGDASSASYFLAAGAISGALAGGAVRVEGIGRTSIQGDVKFVDVLRAMGGAVTLGENSIEVTATPEAARRGRLTALDADLNHIPDAAMTAAMLALFADGTSVLRNVASWRVKETDRLAAMATELRKVGAVVEEGADFLRITPPAAFTDHAEIDTYDDHRIAMCFSLVALGGVAVRIKDPGCVAKTFPTYFDVLASISDR